MPQSSVTSFDDDSDAESVLKDNFDIERGVITDKRSGYRPTDRELEAIQYLCEEWDFAYLP